MIIFGGYIGGLPVCIFRDVDADVDDDDWWFSGVEAGAATSEEAEDRGEQNEEAAIG